MPKSGRGSWKEWRRGKMCVGRRDRYEAYLEGWANNLLRKAGENPDRVHVSSKREQPRGRSVPRETEAMAACKSSAGCDESIKSPWED